MPLDILAAIDRLYQAPLDRFVIERDQLAKELRAAGNREAAASVKRLAKPSTTAWAVNRAWWAEPEAFGGMLDAGRGLRNAQETALRGKPVDLRAAIRARQHAVDTVAGVAFGALGGAAEVSPDAHRRIVSTLEALATSGVPEGVKPGRLTEDLASTGLDVLSALAASLPPMPAVKEKTARTGAKADKKKAEAKEAKAKEAKAKEARAAEARTRKAAEARVAEIEAELARARRELERLK